MKTRKLSILLFTLLISIPLFAKGEQPASFGIWNVVKIFGALAFFIYGMKVMSEGIQKAAGSQMRNILRNMTKNRFLGVLTGFFITAIVQSSSATTVMTVSFVNAGLLSLVESAGIMMGANIGTTITGWLISTLGIGKFKLAEYALPIMAIGLPLLFMEKSKTKHWGQFLIGFALLFMGLSELKESVPDLKNNPEALGWLKNYADMGLLSTIIFVFVGTLVTIIVQSSSAAMALTLVLCSQGVIPFNVAAAMILGENIGTTITAELASLVGNVHAKRSARIHSMFNIVGVTWAIFAMPYMLQFVSWVTMNFFNNGNPMVDAESIPLALSAFHTIFNFTNVCLLLPFVPFLVSIAEKSVVAKDEDDENFRLSFIDTGLKTAELSVVELQTEVSKYGEVTSRMSSFTQKLMAATEPKKRKKWMKKILKYEEITDRVEIELTEYMTKLSKDSMTKRTSIRLRSILNICNDMERIGDIFYEMSKTIEKKFEDNHWFTQHQRDRLNEMFHLVDEAFKEMVVNLSNPHYDQVNLDRANELEAMINKQRNLMREENITDINSEDYNMNSAMTYNNLFSMLEKVGDHIINVSEAVSGQI